MFHFFLMKRVIIKSINFVLAGLLSLLGFTGCVERGLLEYGTPNADYTVKGTVVNKTTGKAIEGIRVGYSPEVIYEAMYGVRPTSYTPKSHVLTNAKGEFILTDRFIAGEYQIEAGAVSIPVYVEDVDGEENGLFQMEYLQVDFSKADQSGKPKNWYEGEYTVTVKVDLTEIENQ